MSTSCPGLLVWPCYKRCTFLHHDPVSVHWLYSLRASRPKLGLVTKWPCLAHVLQREKMEHAPKWRVREKETERERERGREKERARAREHSTAFLLSCFWFSTLVSWAELPACLRINSMPLPPLISFGNTLFGNRVFVDAILVNMRSYSLGQPLIQ